MQGRRSSQRGISLIEAVVALAVMAFGMLAYVGLQSSLRFNSDVAKQRSEAVRIAQQAIEEWRAYAVIETAAGRKAYDDMPAGALPPVAIAGDNASFTLQRSVVDAGDTEDALLRGAMPRMKTLTVDVGWQDRNGETQVVRLSTTITASPPELAATLAVPGSGDPQRLPLGRHAAIPKLAKDLGHGISGYKPPGGGGATTVVVFNNLTGIVVGLCNNVAVAQASLALADVANCSNNVNGLPLSGTVRFATALQQPTAADAENPAGTALNLALALDLTSLVHPIPSHLCFADAPASQATASTAVPYFCIVFFLPQAAPVWSGISTLRPLAFIEDPEHPWTLAADANDASIAHYRVCRYTPAVNDAQVIPNPLHPRNYVNVGPSQRMTDQNFLVIRAGNGVEPFACPTDGPVDLSAGNFVNSNTLPHQPPPAAP